MKVTVGDAFQVIVSKASFITFPHYKSGVF